MNKLANALSSVSLDGLKIFCVAAEHLSFSRAAQALGISPAYVSRRMQALESELDTRLFHRSTRQISLTEQGIVLRSIWDVLPHLEAGRLQRVLPAYRQDASIWAVYPERLGATAKVSTCVKHMEEYFKNWQAPPDPMQG
ncbi:LysR family transcriptional regulator [Alcaligenaceae bacterium]|nr:LysR family transcriptional regulator [Alcaligenaceae bacterium]